jgi:hypothetical protein
VKVNHLATPLRGVELKVSNGIPDEDQLKFLAMENWRRKFLFPGPTKKRGRAMTFNFLHNNTFLIGPAKLPQSAGLPDFFCVRHTKTGKNVPTTIKYSKWP